MCPDLEFSLLDCSSSDLQSSSFLSLLAKPIILKDSGNSLFMYKLYRAGTSFLWVRSPVAPKITMAHDPGIVRDLNPRLSDST